MRKWRALLAIALIALVFGLWAGWARQPKVREMTAATFVLEAGNNGQTA